MPNERVVFKAGRVCNVEGYASRSRMYIFVSATMHS
jgi:hypothetical protein